MSSSSCGSSTRGRSWGRSSVSCGGPGGGGVIRQLREAGFAVIAVDDASTDTSAEEIDAAGAFRVTHPANLGAGGALQTGFEAALAFPDAKFVACFDADGQHQLTDLLGMVETIRR